MNLKLDISDLYLDKHLLFQKITNPVMIFHIENFTYLIYLDQDWYPNSNATNQLIDWLGISNLSFIKKYYRGSLSFVYFIDFEDDENYTEFLLRFEPAKI
jgi:hypothetical protein